MSLEGEAITTCADAAPQPIAGQSRGIRQRSCIFRFHNQQLPSRQLQVTCLQLEPFLFPIRIPSKTPKDAGSRGSLQEHPRNVIAALDKSSKTGYPSPPKRCPASRTDSSAACSNIPPVQHVDELLPSDAVARRPYSGARLAWHAKKGEKVLVKMSSCTIPWSSTPSGHRHVVRDGLPDRHPRGPPPDWQGHDEAEYYLDRTKELSKWIDRRSWTGRESGTR